MIHGDWGRVSKAGRDVEYDDWLRGLTKDQVEARLRDLGVTKVVLKRLSPNQDNSKNQIQFWQPSLNENPLPMGDFEFLESSSKEKVGLAPGYRAKLDFEWLTPSGTNPAPRAQLIHYPQYPESRLSGLLTGAVYAPRTLLSGREASVPGRLLLLGISQSRIIGLALPPSSPATTALMNLEPDPFAMWAITPQAIPISPSQLLAELRGVYDLCPLAGCKVRRGDVVRSTDRNAPGTTLETVLGVKPNSRDEPDFHGWELKSYSSSRVTLMTPAPTGGAVTTMSAAQFMQAFGRANAGNTRRDFNGAHTAIKDPGGKATTRLTVTANQVQLVHRVTGALAMSWRIADLLTHWSRKHALAAYVRRTGSASRGLTFGPYVQLGQGADWQRFRQAIENGTVAFDPAYNSLTNAISMTKARSQIRCYPYELGSLYTSVTVHDLRHDQGNRTMATANLRAEGLSLPTWL